MPYQLKKTPKGSQESKCPRCPRCPPIFKKVLKSMT